MSDTCPLCNGTGLLEAPEIKHIPAPTYAARVAQAACGRLKYCSCEKGKAYQFFLQKKHDDILSDRDFFPDWQQIMDEAATPTFNGEHL